MRFLYLVRLSTMLIAVLGCWASTPVLWISLLEDLFGISGAIYDAKYSHFDAVVEIGVYSTAATAAVIAFVAIPRKRWGPSGLSWCFLAMGACLLATVDCYSDRSFFGSIIFELGCYARQLWFALPSLLFGALLRYSFVRDRLYSSTAADATNV